MEWGTRLPIAQRLGFPRFAIPELHAYLQPMPSKPIELPPEVAHDFAKDMRAFFAEKNGIKRDEIAARQLHALRQCQGSRKKKLRLTDVKEIFLQLGDEARR
jgi:hypothetical protein